MRAPVDYLGQTQGYRPTRNPNHYGIDLGWSSAHGGPNHPILATSDCEVVKAGKMSDGALYVVTRTDKVVEGKYAYCLFWHLSKVNVQAGQSLRMGDSIGIMGMTGTATGVHLHFEVWVTPKSYTAWKLSDKTKYAVDPHSIMHCYADQVTGKDTAVIVKKTDKKLADGLAEGVVPEVVSDGIFPARGYFQEGDTSEIIAKVAEFMLRVFPLYTDKQAEGPYYGPYIKAAITEFQRRRDLLPDGLLGPITFAELERFGFSL